MYQTLSPFQVADLLLADDNAGWSYPGAQAIAEYLEQLDNETNPAGPGSEFDRVSIRCDFAEYSSATEAAADYGFTPEPDEDNETTEADALTWLQERTQVIVFDGGIILQQF